MKRTAATLAIASALLIALSSAPGAQHDTPARPAGCDAGKGLPRVRITAAV